VENAQVGVSIKEINLQDDTISIENTSSGAKDLFGWKIFNMASQQVRNT